MNKKQSQGHAINYNDIVLLLIKKSHNKREYKKYSDAVSNLIFNLYVRSGKLENVLNDVYNILNNANSPNDLLTNLAALENENNENIQDKEGKERLVRTILNDYIKRFGEKKADAYNMLVLQSWSKKVENINELAIIMEALLSFREKVGDSWDFESNLLPIILDKAYNTELLSEYLSLVSNLVIGLNKKLKEPRLASMTATKMIEYSNGPENLKKYIRDLIKEANEELQQLNIQLAELSTSGLSKYMKINQIREINQRIDALNKYIKALTEGVDLKENDQLQKTQEKTENNNQPTTA